MNKTIKKLFVGDMTWKRMLRSVLAVIVLTYLGLVLLGCFYANSMMFPVPDVSYSENDKYVKIVLPDGTKIATHIHSIEKPSWYIIYSHGNAVDLGIMESYLKMMSKIFNCSVISYDYPGYGISEGTPSENSVLTAADATYAYLKSNGVKDSQIIIWGRSIGSGPAVQLAYKNPVAGLILESPFKSAFTVVTRIPILPFDKFKNISVIDKINCPVLIIHGKKDRVIPFYHGEAVFNAASDPKFKFWLDEAGHNDVACVGGQKYWETIKDFLESDALSSEIK